MNGRQARVSRSNDGETLGVAMFVGAAELRELSLDLDGTDRVIYGVESGEIRIEPEPERTEVSVTANE